jgi:hypothetical protein
MNNKNSTNYKINFIRFIIFISAIINFVKSDSNLYTPVNLSPCQNQIEISLNIPKVEKNYFNLYQFEITSYQAIEFPITQNHSCFESFNNLSLINYNNYISAQLKSLRHIFIPEPIIKILHKSNTCQSSKEDLLLS